MSLVKSGDIGLHDIEVILTDNHGASKSYHFPLTIKAGLASLVNNFKGIDPIQKVDEEPKCEESNLAMSISKIDKQGFVDVIFSEMMFDQTVGFVLDRINNESVRVAAVQTETGKNLDLSWSPVWF